jgi:TPR repeat protein
MKEVCEGGGDILSGKAKAFAALLAAVTTAVPASADDATPRLAIPQGHDAFMHLKPGYQPSPPRPAPPLPPEIIEKKARAEKGDAEAQLDVGEFYMRRLSDPDVCSYDQCDGLNEILTEAEKWLRKAAATNSARAEEDLGDILAFKWLPEAADWYLKAAEQNDAGAMAKLSGLYAQGHGVPQDTAAAKRWYQRAAETGHTRDLDLGSILMLRFNEDAGEAVKSLAIPAQTGSAAAQYSLGALYEKGGRGLEARPGEALHWYRLSAEQGNMIAQAQVAKAYAGGGLGAKKDEAEAYFWYLLAASGNPNALDDPVVRARDELRRHLTPKQVMAAEKRARAWKPKAN